MQLGPNQPLIRSLHALSQRTRALGYQPISDLKRYHYPTGRLFFFRFGDLAAGPVTNFTTSCRRVRYYDHEVMGARRR